MIFRYYENISEESNKKIVIFASERGLDVLQRAFLVAIDCTFKVCKFFFFYGNAMNYFQSKLSNIFRSFVIYISGMSSPILPAASVVGKQVAILIIQSFLVTN
jgi:hypothetical protein